MASRLCLDCGLNRLQDNPEDGLINLKRSWFWFTYGLDKGFALNLGLTSSFSDFDITTPYPEFPKGPTFGMITLWLDFAKVQGRIYEDLYSAQGLLKDTASKINAVQNLSAELRLLQTRCKVGIALSIGAF